MGIAAYSWKKMQKTPANEPCLKTSTEFTWKENFLKMFCLMKRWLLNKRAEHGPEGAGTAVPTWDFASTAVFSRKRGRNKSWKHLYQGGERDLGFLRSICDRSLGQVSCYMNAQGAGPSWVCWRHHLTSKLSHSSYVLPQPQILDVKS